MGKRLQTTVAINCMKILLMVFNIIFFITGIVFLVVGIWMKISLNHFLELSKDYSSATSYTFIATGAAIIVVGSLGCWCTVKEQPILLYLFSAFLTLVFILQLGAGISGYAFRNHLKDGFYSGLNNTIYNYGKEQSQGHDLDMLQSYLKCCGVRSYKDWQQVPWAKTTNLTVPNSCCKVKNCHNGHNIKMSDIYHKGCYEKIVDFVNKNINIISSAAVGLAVFQLLGAILSCCLAKHINKSKYEQMA
ncbi:tetraspanin-7-like isoform X1 [Centruroides sculpturatus]|uniref:tetraspanin-7-like isoform X1 n=2 Tax=Centruroides sculpturatus TaxID=218467 RepID=UPI000C6CF12E|nr:tetraspanin-7-like isoform X1 [Centruroides sculpturatus]